MPKPCAALLPVAALSELRTEDIRASVGDRGQNRTHHRRCNIDANDPRRHSGHRGVDEFRSELQR